MSKTTAAAAIMILCGSLSTGVDANDAPKGTVAFFTQATSCPAGWSEAQYTYGRLLLGAPHGTEVPKEVGTAMGNGVAPQHQHSITAEAEVEAQSTAHLANVNNGIGKSGVYQANPVGDQPPNSHAAETGFPFVQYLACEYTKDVVGDAFPQQAVSYFNRTECPAGWIADPSYQGRFLLPVMPGGRVGFQTEAAWIESASLSHEHELIGSINLGNLGFVWGGGADSNTAAQGLMSVEGQLGPSDATLVPYVSLLACRKTESSTAGQLPRHMSILYAGQNCPSRWTPVQGSTGRFLVGAPPSSSLGLGFGGNPMRLDEVSRSHSHLFELTFSVPEYPQDLGKAWSNIWLGTKGEHTANGTSMPADLTLPYYVLSHCQAAPEQLP